MAEPSPLPRHLKVGPGAVAAPAVGGYVDWNSDFMTIPVSQTDTVIWGFLAPAYLRIQGITFATAGTRAGSVTLKFMRHASGTFSVSGATQLHGTDASTPANIVVDGANEENGFVDATSDGIQTLVTAQRDVSPGDAIFLAVTSNGTGTLPDFSCVVSAHMRSFLHEKEEWD